MSALHKLKILSQNNYNNCKKNKENYIQIHH
jgi:hypothetical protein